MFETVKKIGLPLGLIWGCLLASNPHAQEMQEQQNPDWPCDQILVPEVPAAVVWNGPPISGLEQAWEQDKEVDELVRRFTSPDYEADAAEREIADFSAKQEKSQKDHKLTLLFAGVIRTLNETRTKELEAIMRYARGQAARAGRLSEELDEMVRLQDDPSPAAKERLALMQKEMEIKQRMFDDRESFIQHLCTRPIVIEEKLGVLARSIAYYLD